MLYNVLAAANQQAPSSDMTTPETETTPPELAADQPPPPGTRTPPSMLEMSDRLDDYNDDSLVNLDEPVLHDMDVVHNDTEEEDDDFSIWYGEYTPNNSPDFSPNVSSPASPNHSVWVEDPLDLQAAYYLLNNPDVHEVWLHEPADSIWIHFTNDSFGAVQPLPGHSRFKRSPTPDAEAAASADPRFWKIRFPWLFPKPAPKPPRPQPPPPKPIPKPPQKPGIKRPSSAPPTTPRPPRLSTSVAPPKAADYNNRGLPVHTQTSNLNRQPNTLATSTSSITSVKSVESTASAKVSSKVTEYVKAQSKQGVETIAHSALGTLPMIIYFESASGATSIARTLPAAASTPKVSPKGSPQPSAPGSPTPSIKSQGTVEPYHTPKGSATSLATAAAPAAAAPAAAQPHFARRMLNNIRQHRCPVPIDFSIPRRLARGFVRHPKTCSVNLALAATSLLSPAATRALMDEYLGEDLDSADANRYKNATIDIIEAIKNATGTQNDTVAAETLQSAMVIKLTDGMDLALNKGDADRYSRETQQTITEYNPKTNLLPPELRAALELSFPDSTLPEYVMLRHSQMKADTYHTDRQKRQLYPYATIAEPVFARRRFTYNATAIEIELNKTIAATATTPTDDVTSTSTTTVPTSASTVKVTSPTPQPEIVTISTSEPATYSLPPLLQILATSSYEDNATEQSIIQDLESAIANFTHSSHTLHNKTEKKAKTLSEQDELIISLSVFSVAIFILIVTAFILTRQAFCRQRREEQDIELIASNNASAHQEDNAGMPAGEVLEPAANAADAAAAAQAGQPGQPDGNGNPEDVVGPALAGAAALAVLPVQQEQARVLHRISRSYNLLDDVSK